MLSPYNPIVCVCPSSDDLDLSQVDKPKIFALWKGNRRYALHNLGRWKALRNNLFYCNQRVLTELFFWIWVYRKTKWPITARCTCVFSWCEFVSIQQLWKAVPLLVFCLYKEWLRCIVWKLLLCTSSGERILTTPKCSVKFQSCTPAEPVSFWMLQT